MTCERSSRRLVRALICYLAPKVAWDNLSMFIKEEGYQTRILDFTGARGCS